MRAYLCDACVCARVRAYRHEVASDERPESDGSIALDAERRGEEHDRDLRK